MSNYYIVNIPLFANLIVNIKMFLHDIKKSHSNTSDEETIDETDDETYLDPTMQLTRSTDTSPFERQQIIKKNNIYYIIIILLILCICGISLIGFRIFYIDKQISVILHESPSQNTNIDKAIINSPNPSTDTTMPSSDASSSSTTIPSQPNTSNPSQNCQDSKYCREKRFQMLVVSRHSGTTSDLLELGHSFNFDVNHIDVSQWVLMEKDNRPTYKKFTESGIIQALCNEYDIIAASDTLWDSRMMFIPECLPKLLLVITNRFDISQTSYHVKDWHDTINKALESSNGKYPLFIANNPFEEYYMRRHEINFPQLSSSSIEDIKTQAYVDDNKQYEVQHDTTNSLISLSQKYDQNIQKDDKKTQTIQKIQKTQKTSPKPLKTQTIQNYHRLLHITSSSYSSPIYNTLSTPTIQSSDIVYPKYTVSSPSSNTLFQQFIPVIRSLGASVVPLDLSAPLSTSPPQCIYYSHTPLLKVYQTAQRSGDLTVECQMFNIPYGGPTWIRQQNTPFVFVPYQVSVMKQWESVRAGTVMVVPTLEFLERLASQHDWFYFIRDAIRDLKKDKLSYKQIEHFIDFYTPEFAPCVLQFDSWKELSTIVKERKKWEQQQLICQDYSKYYVDLQLVYWHQTFQKNFPHIVLPPYSQAQIDVAKKILDIDLTKE